MVDPCPPPILLVSLQFSVGCIVGGPVPLSVDDSQQSSPQYCHLQSPPIGHLSNAPPDGPVSPLHSAQPMCLSQYSHDSPNNHLQFRHLDRAELVPNRKNPSALLH